MALPVPEPGLVISFNYLWRREFEDGGEIGRYPRPCAIVVALRQEDDGALVVAVAPLTTKQPTPNHAAVEIPPTVKRHLGLDDRPSWAIVDEVNEFVWPGFDIEPDADGRTSYGYQPPKLFARIRDRLFEALGKRTLGRVPR